MTTSYAGARTLATINHEGYLFRVVRRRPAWRKSLVLLHGDDCVSENTYPESTDPTEAAAEFKRLLDRFPDKAAFEKALQEALP